MPSNQIGTYLARGTKASLAVAPNVGTSDTAIQVSTDTNEGFVFNGTAMLPVALLSRPLFPTLSTTAVTGTAGQTLPAASLLSGILLRSGATAVVTDTTDTAANIVALIPSCIVGSSFEFRFVNGDTFAKTIAGGTGVTVLGATSIGGNSNVVIQGIVTNATSGSCAVTIYIPTGTGGGGSTTVNLTGSAAFGAIAIGGGITNVYPDLTGGSNTVQLPVAGTRGREVRIVDFNDAASSTVTLTITVTAGGTMSGATSIIFSRPGSSNTFLDNGTQWSIIA